MSKMVTADDGLVADEVGGWAIEKHSLLIKYIEISRAARRKYLGPGKAGSCYIDLFCGTGRSRIRDTDEWVDGSAVAAWKASAAADAPFTRVIIGDSEGERLEAASARLERLGATVVALHGKAHETAASAAMAAGFYGLHFAFLDPYSLGALDFRALKDLAGLKRIDMLVHVSVMDMQRNLDAYIAANAPEVDAFAPGWREALEFDGTRSRNRSDLFTYWQSLVKGSGIDPSKEVRLVKGDRQQRLYWLLLVAKHALAHQFWSAISKDSRQTAMDF